MTHSFHITPLCHPGPAGAGKTTFCSSIITHAQTLKRTIHYVNLDPAATSFDYEPAVDIRDLIDLQDVMEELEFGPNGGLVYCFEWVIGVVSGGWWRRVLPKLITMDVELGICWITWIGWTINWERLRMIIWSLIVLVSRVSHPLPSGMKPELNLLVFSRTNRIIHPHPPPSSSHQPPLHFIPRIQSFSRLSTRISIHASR